MEFARLVKPLKTFVIDFKAFFFTAKFCKFSPTRPMIAVVRVIKTTRIMENGKQPHHIHVCPSLLRQQHSVVFHLVPMLNAMNLGLVEPIFKSKVHKRSEINHRGMGLWAMGTVAYGYL